MNDKARLNPEVRQVDIGVRELRTISIYPLSLNDQISVVNMLATIIEEFSVGVSTEDATTEDILGFVSEFLVKNVDKILEFVTDEAERPSMEELTNSQSVEIGKCIFEVNFEDPVKNFQSLFQKGKAVFGQEPQRKRNRKS